MSARTSERHRDPDECNVIVVDFWSSCHLQSWFLLSSCSRTGTFLRNHRLFSLPFLYKIESTVAHSIHLGAESSALLGSASIFMAQTRIPVMGLRIDRHVTANINSQTYVPPEFLNFGNEEYVATLPRSSLLFIFFVTSTDTTRIPYTRTQSQPSQLSNSCSKHGIREHHGDRAEVMVFTAVYYRYTLGPCRLYAASAQGSSRGDGHVIAHLALPYTIHLSSF